MPETGPVACAAIKLKNGRVLIGKRHSDILYVMYRLGLSVSEEHDVQGFMTQTGEFLDRVEAADLARKSGQVPNAGSKLYSEDLY